MGGGRLAPRMVRLSLSTKYTVALLTPLAVGIGLLAVTLAQIISSHTERGAEASGQLTADGISASPRALCEALESTREDTAVTAFERLFAERRLPFAIRSDNGVPFASPNALFNLSELSVWWLRLGIAIERIKPGKPQQNGRHERMHLTLKKEATRPPE
jgi:hypothetical protein